MEKVHAVTEQIIREGEPQIIQEGGPYDRLLTDIQRTISRFLRYQFPSNYHDCVDRASHSLLDSFWAIVVAFDVFLFASFVQVVSKQSFLLSVSNGIILSCAYKVAFSFAYITALFTNYIFQNYQVNYTVQAR